MSVFLSENETTFKIEHPKIWSDKDIIDPILNNIPEEINNILLTHQQALTKIKKTLEPLLPHPHINYFDFYTDLFQFYENRKGAQLVSTEWLQMYQIIDNYELIGNKRTVNALFNTSLLGDVISATNHYCQTHRIDFEWLANSNNIDDKNNILYNYRSNWLMNDKMNGNLTSLENIKNIKHNVKQKFSKGVDLYFSTIVDENNAILNFGQIVSGLTILTSGGHFIVKISTFFTALDISIISLLSNMFKDFYIIRPDIIPCTNSEVYLLGRNFIGLLPTLEQKLFSIMNKLVEIGEHDCANYSFYQNSTRIKSLLENFCDISNNIYVIGQIPLIETAIQLLNTVTDPTDIRENLGPIYIEKQDKFISRFNIKKLHIEETLNTMPPVLKVNQQGGLIRNKTHFVRVFQKGHSSRLYYTFLNIFNKPFNYKNSQEIEVSKKIFKLLEQDVKNGLADERIYHNLHSNMNKLFYDVFGPPKIFTDGRANSRVDDIKQIFNNISDMPLVDNYIDFGCGEACITEAISKEINATNVIGMDIKPPKNTVSFTFVQLDPYNHILPADNNSTQLITCFMVLHHLTHPEEYIKEFSRVLQPGGILLIREHDIQGDNDTDGKLFLDILHGFYEVVWAKTGNQENPDFVKNYFANYKNRQHWTNSIENNGFKRITTPELDHFYNFADIHRVYAFGKKIKNPFYHYYAVYKKQ